LSNSENLGIFPLDMDIADHAVALRARHGFKTSDAIQIGTALACGADYIVTNDRDWRRFKKVRVLMVGDL
jgi:predicted nucleic acid-binding protein